MSSMHGRDTLGRIRRALRLDELSPTLRKVIVGTVGGCVLLAGLALVFLPGPAFVVIPLGLAILASEFAWARHYLQKARQWFERSRDRFRNRKQSRKAAELPVK